MTDKYRLSDEIKKQLKVILEGLDESVCFCTDPAFCNDKEQFCYNCAMNEIEKIMIKEVARIEADLLKEVPVEKLKLIPHKNDPDETPKGWTQHQKEDYIIGYVIGHEDGAKSQLASDQRSFQRFVLPLIEQAQKEERDKIYHWGQVLCNEHNKRKVPEEIGGGFVTLNRVKRRHCNFCWQALQKEGE